MKTTAAYDIQARFKADRVAEVHCHCLPDLDDGPRDWAASIELCRMMHGQGVTHVVATPHQFGQYDGCYTAAQIRQRVTDLNAQLAGNQIAIKVFPGADVRLDERIPTLLRSGQVLTLADEGRYMLLELIPAIELDPLPLIVQLVGQGVTPIITHPERVAWLERRASLLMRWVEAGAAIQVTSGALLGDFGSRVRASAWEMLRLPGLMVVASDAHNASRRPPRLAAAAQAIEHELGYDFARRVCIENPVGLIGSLTPRATAGAAGT